MKQILISIFALGFLAVNLSAQHKPQQSMKKGMHSYQIGDKIEDFQLPNVDGEMISLSNYEEAQGYIIVFTSNVCPFAVASEEKLIQIHNQMAPKGYPVIAINSNNGDTENLQSMELKVSEIGMPFPYLKDDKSVYQKFGATKTPHVFLVDKNMVLQYMGSIDDNPRSPESVKENYLADAVENIMNNRSPDPAVTKSIGCPIKRGKNEGRGGEKGGEEGKGGERKGPPSPEAMLQRMDKNNDMKISKDEAHGPLAEHFNEIDIDKNGELSVEELSKARKRKEH